MILIPAIDLSENKVVRLKKGEFDQKTFYPHRPLELIQDYINCGSDWVHIVDLDGAQDPKSHQHQFIATLLKNSKAHFQVGGGLRTREQIENILDNGLQRVTLSSFVFQQNKEFINLVQKYGPKRFCIALDIKLDATHTPNIYLRGWQEKSTASFAESVTQMSELGIEWILCTDIDRDGLMQGPHFEFYADLKKKYKNIKWIASGGVRSIQDVVQLKNLKVDACVVGKALLENHITLAELKNFNAGDYAH